MFAEPKLEDTGPNLEGTSLWQYGPIVAVLLNDPDMKFILHQFVRKASRLSDEDLERLQTQTGFPPHRIKQAVTWMALSVPRNW